MTDLTGLAERLGPLATFLLFFLGLAVFMIEKLMGKGGPVTRLLSWISDRELRRMRRQAELERERRRMLRDAESETVTHLRERIDDLDEEIRWYRRESNDLRRRDRHFQDFERDMAVWLAENLPKIRRADPTISDPPEFEPLAELLVLDDDVADLDPPPGRDHDRGRLERWD